jgi:ABC-type transport system involved in cytochrome c biogenesis ATPase subunit
MQIHGIHIKNFLSFETFSWEDIDPHLTVIVGPNGVGKTNLFRAVQVVRDVLRPGFPQAAATLSNARRGTEGEIISIALDVQFTSAWEQKLLCAFFAAVLCNQQSIQETMTSVFQRGVDANRLRRFDTWVQEQVRPEHLSWLMSGRLGATLVGQWGWQCSYEALPGRPVFRADVTRGETLVGHAEHHSQTAMQNWRSLFAAWRTSLSERERARLDNSLTGASPEGEFPLPDLSCLPAWVSSQQGVALQISDEMQIVDPATLATRRAFTSLAQVSLEPGRPLGIHSVFQRLLDQALVFTDNMRMLPQCAFVAEQMLEQPVDLSNGSQLARVLFCKKNGDERSRQQYRAIQELFARVTGRSCEVVFARVTAERLSSGQAPDVSLQIVTGSGAFGDIPLEFSGAGIAEALFLSTLIAESDGRIVLLDEPASNIHVTMQKALMNEIRTRSQNETQFFIVTHSPTLVDPAMLSHISYFSLHDGHTMRAPTGPLQMSMKDRKRLEQELRKTVESRALLFSRSVLLVEGETELAVLPIWFEQTSGQSFEGQDIAVYNVGGDQNFKPLLQFLHWLRIPWAIVCDGKVISYHLNACPARSSNKSIVEQLDEAGIPCSTALTRSDFAQLCQELETCGVFTFAKNPGDEIEALPIIQQHTAEASKLYPTSKVRQGQHIAETYPCPKEVATLLQKIVHHLLSRPC